MSSLDTMIPLAREAMRRAYAPYSKFPVGACLRTDGGRFYAAANVENAAYPQGQCAEASAIGMMVAGGDLRIVEVVVMGGTPGDGMLCTPCGGCRQKLAEFGRHDTPVLLATTEGATLATTVGELLPGRFDAGHMAKAE